MAIRAVFSAAILALSAIAEPVDAVNPLGRFGNWAKPTDVHSTLKERDFRASGGSGGSGFMGHSPASGNSFGGSTGFSAGSSNGGSSGVQAGGSFSGSHGGSSGGSSVGSSGGSFGGSFGGAGTTTGTNGGGAYRSGYGQNWISSQQQNGASSWGTLNQTSLPYSAGGGHSSGHYPWGGISTSNSDPYTSAPHTSVTRTYHLTLASCDISPDGVQTKGAICVNGQFPGPLIEANYGDTISVTVTNNLVGEGTSIHWHGFLQTKHNEMDGVPGVTQCPIAPGQSYTYNFRAELYGTTWYHSHYSSQYSSGAVGPLVVYGPWNSGYDVDIGPVMLQEVYRADYKTNVAGLMTPLSKGGPKRPTANSNLINGKMMYDCKKTSLPCKTAAYSQFSFSSGKNHRLRLMNTGSGAVQKFSIDGHTMQVIANDFMPIVPYNTSMIALGVGQRADVIVFGSGKTGEAYWMRSNIVTCSINDGILTEARAVIYYQGADISKLPSAQANQGPAATTSIMACGNDPLTLTVPTYTLPAAEPSVSQEFEISTKSNGTHILFYMGNNSFKANFNDPILGHAVVNTLGSLPANRNVWNLGSATTARAIIYNYNDAPHPIHLHGHNMQVLSLGMGKWDGSIVRSSNPQRRDVQVMPPALNENTPSFLIIQWTADNPGVWSFHCHFAWHSAMGLVTNIVEGGSSLAKSATRGGHQWSSAGLASSAMSAINPTCQSWNAWTATNKLLTDIDSGL